MKVCVYGAGAVGTVLAARLDRSGAKVSMVARGATLAAIRARGISVSAPDYRIETQVEAVEDPSTLGPQDFVVVTVKSPALPDIVRGLGPLLGPQTSVAFVMNGIPWWYFHEHGGDLAGRRFESIDPGGHLWDTVGPERAIGGVLFCACDTEAPGVAHVETAKAQIFLGQPGGAGMERVQALAGMIRGEDAMVSEAVPDIRATIWSKLQMNSSSGLLGCLSNSPPREIYTDPAVADAVRRIVDEVGAIARSMGCETGATGEGLLARTIDQAHRPSIVQDLDSGRAVEIDPMFGIPLEIARMRGVATPTLDFLVALVKARARRAGAYAG